MVAMALFEDVPQLVVQARIWVQLSAASNLSNATFAFSVAVTSVDLLVAAYTVHHQARALPGISLPRYVGYVLGLALPGDDFARAFARQLEAGTYPGGAQLMLRGGGVTDDGAVALAEALKRVAADAISNKRKQQGDGDGSGSGGGARAHSDAVLLTTLNLAQNKTGDAGAAALAEALEADGCPLTALRLWSNAGITDDGGYARLGRALEANTTLTTLRLDGDHEGGKARKAALTARHGKRIDFRRW